MCGLSAGPSFSSPLADIRISPKLLGPALDSLSASSAAGVAFLLVNGEKEAL
jgi:hypothetical protein